ncbi:MAG: ABC transporter ATP-binding protein [Clostridiales bacterium]|jgi:spermidine/putrescine ABC transporter ATP-binding subunit|nr:ABC transporter ATP-binding protein [Eubacteriales bacterium]MDH7565689.1 ABC transporter ATP-binding protein [Clostridiales bacterium]
MPFLSIKDLTKIYDGQRVLDSISFDVEQGTFLSLLGPSGCGKTTTLRVIAGFVRPDGGSVNLNGILINNLPTYKRNIGMVFQSYALFPHMTVEQNIAYGLEQRRLPRNEIRKEVAQVLEMVQLTGYEKRKPKQLSGGQQQRVALARALVIKPSLLLLDESLSALDKKLRVEMQVELRQIQQKVGITTIFVTHDQEEALTLSDKIAVMDKGRIVQLDTPVNVYERPATTFVAGFLGKANFFKGSVVEKHGDVYQLKMENGHVLPFESLRDPGVGTDLTVAVRPEKIALSGEEPEGTWIKGTVKFTTYAGDRSLYRLEALGQTIEVERQNSLGISEFKIHDEVYISWDKSNTLLLDR